MNLNQATGRRPDKTTTVPGFVPFFLAGSYRQLLMTAVNRSFPPHLVVELGDGVDGQVLRPRHESVLGGAPVPSVPVAARGVPFVDELDEPAEVGGPLPEVPGRQQFTAPRL